MIHTGDSQSYTVGTTWRAIAKKVVCILSLNPPIQTTSTFVLATVFTGGLNYASLEKASPLKPLNPSVHLSHLMCMDFNATLPALQAMSKVLQDLPWTWAIAWVFWTPVLAANMKLVPLANQAVVGGVAWAVWNVFLAYVANKEVE